MTSRGRSRRSKWISWAAIVCMACSAPTPAEPRRSREVVSPPPEPPPPPEEPAPDPEPASAVYDPEYTPQRDIGPIAATSEDFVLGTIPGYDYGPIFNSQTLPYVRLGRLLRPNSALAAIPHALDYARTDTALARELAPR